MFCLRTQEGSCVGGKLIAWVKVGGLVGAVNGLLITAAVILRARQKQRSDMGPRTPIGRLIDLLVLHLAFLYASSVGPLFLILGLDPYVLPVELIMPPAHLDLPPHLLRLVWAHTHIFFQLVEGATMLILFWHMTIAYIIYSYIVKKRSASRMRKHLHRSMQVAVTLLFILVRAAVVWRFGAAGWRISTLVSRCTIPIGVGVIIYCHVSTVMELNRGRALRTTQGARMQLGCTSRFLQFWRLLLPSAATFAAFVHDRSSSSSGDLVLRKASEDTEDDQPLASPTDAVGNRELRRLDTRGLQPAAAKGDEQYEQAESGGVPGSVAAAELKQEEPGVGDGVGVSRSEAVRYMILIRRLMFILLLMSFWTIHAVTITFLNYFGLNYAWIGMVEVSTFSLGSILDLIIMFNVIDVCNCSLLQMASTPREERSPQGAGATSSASVNSVQHRAPPPSHASQLSQGASRGPELSVVPCNAQPTHARSASWLSHPVRWVAKMSSHVSHTHPHQPIRPGIVRMFVSTWNAGGVAASELEAKLPLVVHRWVPPGYDLYVLGFQECLCRKALTQIIHGHLGGPGSYTCFAEEMGDVHLNGVIALVVFARASDVETRACVVQEGAVKSVAVGVKVGPVRVPNKGMVGMSLRYFDRSIALIAAHFASDLKGKNRVAQRNEDACKVLRDLSLLRDSERFDVHTQHHHTVLLGDLNYRVQSPPHEVLKLVAASARATARTSSSTICAHEQPPASPRDDAHTASQCDITRPMLSSWRRSSVARFHLAASTTCVIPRNELADAGTSHWSWVHELDELSLYMSDRASGVQCVLRGFTEGVVAFPPSYRWQRGGEGGDFTDVAHLQAHAYTTCVSKVHKSTHGPVREAAASGSYDGPEESSGVDAPSVKPSKLRTPSYTDRILTHSLEGCREGLRWVHYDMIDGVTMSDHRPVSGALEMTVDRAVKGCTTGATERSPLHHQRVSLRRGADDGVRRFTIKLSRPEIRWAVAADALQCAKQQPKEVVILFPLSSEDPLAHLRNPQSLVEVFPGTSSDVRDFSMAPADTSDPRSGTAGNVRSAAQRVHPSTVCVPWGAFPVRHTVFASLRFSEHMLLKVVGPDATAIGQAVVVLRNYVRSSSLRSTFEVCSGGVLMAWLTVDVKVRLGASSNGWRS